MINIFDLAENAKAQDNIDENRAKNYKLFVG